MKTLVECEWQKGEDDDGNPLMAKDQFYLLYWGLDYEVIQIDEERRMPATYTVGVCAHVDTGKIRLFEPEQITILGREIRE